MTTTASRPRWRAYMALARLDKPIGTLLLLWPTLWALWIAGDGHPSFWLLLVFVAGVFSMRSAGCVINDYADRHIDGHVKRTQGRPLPSGELTERQALGFFALLVGVSFLLVLTTNALTIKLAVAGLGWAALYPFMKRYTNLPQLFLGIAFSWAIPMAFAAQSNSLPPGLWLLFAANLTWTIAYDTMYAMVDRDDDLRIGVKSTAILFGRRDKLIVGLLQLLTLILLVAAGQQFALGPLFYWGLLGAAGLFVYQQRLIRDRERMACFGAFLNNNYVGMLVFAGLVLSLL
ncbi:4-hydroxybenzoate octaprenyltransferase [Oceanisphaera psychrotolerans]|uniref:4-hydroxybenzoate octaprenyltransferase n=1 Tax=Oceanisphaera psychrotolerans TaxID=1414654 RepID=A0A1J4QGP5_9GAMM|nr:4-hydroxybenzoate octaprenyltransferase [Oceanisphaera psychrotolerans]OIN09561.1 4-hydroxybenzoate polyprenyltransferase [Oceanisphaera psychrotolerans]